MEPTLTELLTRETLRRLAGQRSFERGEEYAESGAVGSLQWDESSIRAGVQGTNRYRVRLEATSGTLAGSCTCPVGLDGLFCKHCVAVGLAWLSHSSERDEAAAPTRSELQDRLAALGAEALAGFLVEQALDDEYLHARLLAPTADATSDSDTPFRQVRTLFTRLEQEDSFDELTREIRERHRAKRNLIKRLDERGWGLPIAARAPQPQPAKRAVHS